MDFNDSSTKSLDSFLQAIRNIEEKNSLKRLTSNENSINNRFGTKSRNMFFIRHTAHPRNLRFLTGIDGSMICSVQDDKYNLSDKMRIFLKSFESTVSQEENSTNNLNNSYNNNLLRNPKYTLNIEKTKELLKNYEDLILPKLRKERILPPMQQWTNTYMLIDDTRKWKSELNNLAKKIGIFTLEERLENEMEKPKTRKFLKYNSTVTDNSCIKKNLFKDSFTNNKTSNKTETRSRHTGSKSKFKNIYCNDDNERETWILNTESMQEIQSWLTSSKEKEKEAMKDLIQRAIEGLNQAGRLNLNEKKSNLNNFDFENLKESIQKINEKGDIDRKYQSDSLLDLKVNQTDKSNRNQKVHPTTSNYLPKIINKKNESEERFEIKITNLKVKPYNEKDSELNLKYVDSNNSKFEFNSDKDVQILKLD